MREAELQRQVEGRQRVEAGFAVEREELKRQTAHWNGRWEEVAMKLRLSQAKLEEVQREREQEARAVSPAFWRSCDGSAVQSPTYSTPHTGNTL